MGNRASRRSGYTRRWESGKPRLRPLRSPNGASAAYTPAGEHRDGARCEPSAKADITYFLPRIAAGWESTWAVDTPDTLALGVLLD